MNATTFGVDLSKSVFQVSLANQAGRARRDPDLKPVPVKSVKATIALANKMARIIWVTWTRAQDYDPR